MEVLGHKHPLKLIDLELEHSHNEEEDEEEEEEDDSLNVKEEFRCICARCDQDISEYHRYYYKCVESCDYSLHKFCAEALKMLEHTSHHPHPLSLGMVNLLNFDHKCNVCRSGFEWREVIYQCVGVCFRFSIHLKCALDAKEKVLNHPSHPHALMCNISKPVLCDCNACGKEHRGIFYSCILCSSFTIHSDCAFSTKKLLIQKATKEDFYHTHPLTLSYSFPYINQRKYSFPNCRVCGGYFDEDYNLWIYQCEKCRYFVHMDCASSRSRREPFMSIVSSSGLEKLIKNYQDSDHPDLLHLPFPDQSYSIPKHLLQKQTGSKIFGSDKVNLKRDLHEHPLILVENDDATPSTSSKIYSISCHDPMKRVELLCNGCLRPITSTPFYKCANKEQHCNFVLHEWCTRLPTEIKNHPEHNHTLTLITSNLKFFFNVFRCFTCFLPSNGFAYGCIRCQFFVDVSCGLLPEKITHDAHPNHLLSRVKSESPVSRCQLCGDHIGHLSFIAFSCNICNFHLHSKCAYLCPRSIRHKIDKHPLDLCYVPIENHKSDYFCEICELELNPQRWFYHCHKCAQSMHTHCVSLILKYENSLYILNRGVHRYVNIKFGGTHKLECHSHPLSFVQGFLSDGKCVECLSGYLMEEMIFKCEICNYAIDFKCCARLSHSRYTYIKY